MLTISLDDIALLQNKVLRRILAKRAQEAVTKALEKVKANPTLMANPDIAELYQTLAILDSLQAPPPPKKRKSIKAGSTAP
jgi:hypothetical protein